MSADIRSGTSDTRLTPRGREQAALTGRRITRIVRESKTAVFCAPSSRARETADILGSILGIAPETTTVLATIGDGLSATTPASHSEAPRLPRSRPRIDWQPHPQAETWRMLHRRIDTFLQPLVQSTVSYIVLVTHGVPHVAIVQWWIGYTERMLETAFFDINISPCGITRLSLNSDGDRTIICLNDVSHLLATQATEGEG